MTAALDPGSISLGSPTALAYLFLGGTLFAGIAALSHSHRRDFSAAMIYLGLSGAAGVVVRFGHVGKLASPLEHPGILEFATKVALSLGLFATGMRIRRKPTVDGWHLSIRLIVVAMPATVAAAAAWARGLMGLGLGAAIVLGAALAPTDPVLAGDLGVDAPGEEEKDEEPEAEFVLTTEAALNDGAGMPFLLLGLALAGHGSLSRWGAVDLVYAVVGGIVVGAVLGRAIAIGANALRAREFLSNEYDRWIGLAAALAVYGAAESLGTLGFLAAFAGGVAFRRHELESAYRRQVHDGASVITHFAELAVIIVLGSTLVVGNFGDAGGWGMALAVLSVFVLRPLIAFATLSFTQRLSPRERMWVSWFGVKGVASLNYAAAAAGAAVLGVDRPAIVWTVLIAVTLSILVHGSTATALTKRLLGR